VSESGQLYGIVQMPDVMSAIAQDSAAQVALMQTIFGLQANPRPEGHEAKEEFGIGVASLLCEKTVPPYTILYRVDEEQQRVVVLAVYEKRWS
jgi:hypothetical protein